MLTIRLAAWAVDLLRNRGPCCQPVVAAAIAAYLKGGEDDDHHRAYLHVRLPCRRGDSACRDDQIRSASKSLKRGNVVSIRCRFPLLRDLITHIFDVVEVVVVNQSNQIALPFSFELDLFAWTNAVCEKAVGEGFIRMPWEPDDAFIQRLQAYFHTGLSPAEAVSACFCPNH
ncbi:hypothetical protein [Paraburkholderia kirstenboschensis]|uniref:Uncharacterized protein n=1 Tax=Paraburkholderia kirstenboschensis TaxID=1245436 RepID=A0ABZ0E8Q6_9BURK|nr:hypothetical protein [Paraburkholderia kirstenboschensis]WOD13617.1 hypothetical protein RW095_06420 [Paraburkholderia kirstenboschensis]